MKIPVSMNDAATPDGSPVDIRHWQVSARRESLLLEPSFCVSCLALQTNPFPAATTNSFQQVYDSCHSINNHDRDESVDSFKSDERSSKGKRATKTMIGRVSTAGVHAELSIDEYLPKTQSVHSPLSAITPAMTSSPSNLRPSTSVIVNTSSPVDDCGACSMLRRLRDALHSRCSQDSAPWISK